MTLPFSNTDRRTLVSALRTDIAAVAGSMPTSWRHPRRLRTLFIAAVGLGLALTFTHGALAQQHA